MKLSIIIPVYNVEQTLARCVDSVLRQKFRNFQLILVDDGSTDRSGEICDELTKLDHRIQTIHQPNKGLSAARNTGIKRAKGEYITFIDSDDYIHGDTLKPLMDILAIHHEYDFIEYPVDQYVGKRGKQRRLFFRQQSFSDMRAYWYETQAFRHAYAWNKIYRRDLFQAVKFPEGKKFEDVFTLPQLLGHCKTVATVNEGLYYYCHNPNGITETADGEALNNLLTAHLNVLNGDSMLTPVSYDYYAHVLNIALDVAEATGTAPSLPSLDSVCQRQDGEPKPLKIRLLKLIGMKNLCRLNTLIHKFRRKSR